MVPVLVRKFKELLTTGYSTEHDITGVSDPFLQVHKQYARSNKWQCTCCRSKYFDCYAYSVAVMRQRLRVWTICSLKLPQTQTHRKMSATRSSTRRFSLSWRFKVNRSWESVNYRSHTHRQLSTLQTLGTNVLGRYLINADKNIRYVALNTLLKTATIDLDTVQRYRKLVLDNLKDADVSIRRWDIA